MFHPIWKFETVIYSQLYEYFEIHKIIINSQHGFQKIYHSTVYIVIQLIDKLINVLTNVILTKYHLTFISIFLKPLT